MVEAKIRRQFGLPVSFDPALSSREFFLVVSFGRCKFRLTETTVAALLQSVIGGIAENFHIQSLGDRVFRFSVSSQAVGFHVYKLRFLSACFLSSTLISGMVVVQITCWNSADGKILKKLNGPRWGRRNRAHRRCFPSPVQMLFQ